MNDTLTPDQRDATAKAALAATNALDNGAPPLTKAEMKANAEQNRKDPDWVWIPEWGSRVDIRRLGALEHEETITFASAGGTFNRFRQAVKAIEIAAIDPTFDLDDDGDWEMLRDADPTTLFNLFAGISILSNLRDGRVAEFQRMFPRDGDDEDAGSAAEEAAGIASDREGEEPDTAADVADIDAG